MQETMPHSSQGGAFSKGMAHALQSYVRHQATLMAQFEHILAFYAGKAALRTHVTHSLGDSQSDPLAAWQSCTMECVLIPGPVVGRG